jgi:hypothetical protein
MTPHAADPKCTKSEFQATAPCRAKFIEFFLACHWRNLPALVGISPSLSGQKFDSPDRLC